MSTASADRLYNLLPAIYRIKDVGEGEPLRALLAVINAEAQKLETDIAGLYDNWFIETCDEWVVPYIGDLLGVRGLRPLQSGTFSRRAYVANTLAYRRRKGTAAVLEQLARDVTGWPARVVEFFALLGTTQHQNHIRLQNVRTPDLRDTNRLGLLDTPFDTIGHTAEVRRIASERGKYNIPNVGLFLWRLQSYAIALSTPRSATDPPDGRYWFSPLGNDAPLFTRPQTEREITQLADETNVPQPIRQAAFYADLVSYHTRYATTPLKDRPPDSVYYGPNGSLNIITGSEPVPPIAVICMDLSNWDRPPAGQVGVDVRRGRLAFATGETPNTVQVSYNYGFSADIGGGPYDRRGAPAQPKPSLFSLAQDFTQELDNRQISAALKQEFQVYNKPLTAQAQVQVDQPGSNWTIIDDRSRYAIRKENQALNVYPGQDVFAAPDTVATPAALDALIRVPSTGIATLADALAAWHPATAPRTVIQIDDNRTYEEDLTIPMAGAELVIQAANRKRPVLLGNIAVTGGTGAESLTLNGLLIAGALNLPGNLAAVTLAHCTLVPGLGLDETGAPLNPAAPSVIAAATNDRLQLTVDHSITGALRLSEEIAGLTVRDSIVDSPTRGGRAATRPVLISGNLAPFPALGPETPKVVNVTIGDDGPYPATLPGTPTTLADARDQLQAAIQAAHDSEAFTGARVVSAANRLVVLPGTPGIVVIEPAGADGTAAGLRLVTGAARQVFALVSGSLAGFTGTQATAPQINVTMGGDGPHLAALSAAPTSLAQARDQLQAAIQAADSGAAFTGTIVGTLDDRLVVLPGTDRTEAIFGPASGDATTITDLALETDRPAIAASDGGQAPGPPATLERATVLGATYVKELTLASEVIFTGLVLVEHRQAGCARFSYVPPASRTPQRYRCQPDLEITAEIVAAEQEAKNHNTVLSPAEAAAVAARVRAWLRPAFTASRYGRAAYGQLGATCPTQITTGAADGAEMGVFNSLQGAVREANLRTALTEHLRFGLEAGIFYVS